MDVCIRLLGLFCPWCYIHFLSNHLAYYNDKKHRMSKIKGDNSWLLFDHLAVQYLHFAHLILRLHPHHVHNSTIHFLTRLCYYLHIFLCYFPTNQNNIQYYTFLLRVLIWIMVTLVPYVAISWWYYLCYINQNRLIVCDFWLVFWYDHNPQSCLVWHIVRLQYNCQCQ